MPRYFFDIDDGTHLLRDEVGIELPTVYAARDEASRAMGDLAKEHLPSAAPQKNMIIWVRNEDGTALLSLSFSFAIPAL